MQAPSAHIPHLLGLPSWLARPGSKAPMGPLWAYASTGRRYGCGGMWPTPGRPQGHNHPKAPPVLPAASLGNAMMNPKGLFKVFLGVVECAARIPHPSGLPSWLAQPSSKAPMGPLCAYASTGRQYGRCGEINQLSTASK
ncbi:hypothetical protein PTTG_26967 [Puccinia triticina 1-1 BBBD Race 1]|uniref:Uncharacterized protein n=1 Tax=Puccinia triticina (isolate 1-1 / race 1 (BBBD)) TaxID=630390 RepID=A0A180GR61_PUCT1|nr:hypothetical protein PTTG_26967 [Puccinia triticina 1-1 BBBD Race 1]